ncbi:MAG: hypothetical protein HXX08_22650 [Chloroflexi bacterium]|uniref:SMP-30/Gluconolactonase/LRE-like region domain-containing protein n=1 Tax=Candidatus Chlorohelix allophototropha TaxID=3003348 RepID=A0A8T7M969_9CHLR|nr:hypothetical protein [Chloroflexota bacterium]WJW68600.1 hypothetical protein OZ401_004214 [Chloroflexota bacterium L227-S17]
MRNVKKFSLAMVSMLLVFQLTLGMSFAKEQEEDWGKDGHGNLQTLVKGSPIHGANGIAFHNGLLYIASVFGSEIVVMNPYSGQIVKRLGQEYGVQTPDDLVFGPDGSLYWTSLFTGEVGKLAPDGVTHSIVATNLPGANAIAFTRDFKRLFVSADFFGNGLYEIDPTGANTTPIDILKFPEYGVPNVAGEMNAMAFGADGYLYGPMYNKGRVVKVNVATKEITTVLELPQPGINPAAVKFDSQERLNIVTSNPNQVIRLNLHNMQQEVLANPVSGIDNLAFDSHGRLFISDASGGSISEILKNKQLREVSPAGMMAAGGVAVLPGKDGHDRVFVADFWTLRQYDGKSGTPKPLGKFTSAVQPMTVAPFGDKLVWTSINGNAVQIWDPVTKQVVQDYRDFAGPTNAIEFRGNLVVAEIGTGKVVMQNPAEVRTVLTTIQGIPFGLASNDKELYAADWYSGLIYKLAEGGTIIAKPNPILNGHQFSQPEGLALERDGHLLVVEVGAGRLSRVDLKTGTITTVVDKLQIGAWLPLLPPTTFFNGVAVGHSGTIYLTADKANALYRIRGDND